VARATYMLAKGNNFYTWRESYAFAFRKAGSVLLTPVSLAVLIGMVVVGALILGLLGKIPYAGELGISLFTVIWFFAALLLFFFAVILLVSIILVPSIIATTDEDAFEAVFQTFSLTWSQPWRLVIYEGVITLLSLFAMGLFAYAAKEAFIIMNALLSSFMCGDYINLMTNGQAMVQSWLLMIQNVVQSIYGDATPWIYFRHEFIPIPASELPLTVVISSYLYGLSLLFIMGWVFSYGVSTFTAGNTLLYVILRKKKDDENLLERVDKEEEEEEEEETEGEAGAEGEEKASEEKKSESED
jgi:hypothetical protein